MGINNIEISRLTLEDIDDLMVVEKLSFTIPWSREAFIEEITNNKFARYIVAKVNGKAIGYAGFWKVFDEGHITNVAVHPEYRRIGVGYMLVKSLIDMAEEESISRMTLEVRKSNIPAQNLYAKFGFQVEGFRKEYYADNKEDAIIMWRENS
ncbi:ribosomal protein S18-alanine N-acetyltransferase [Acetivibrio clariflavus]|uniref:[Ribosomal protein bS18]-alanine N-acetyltransferase n=1 Tax=Acetivibrio clariflavus (strain DSM 19732 / NBRC 101661 / EBR45) TaxID=720554 RepID=G8M1Q9_ACECE|nr:ribosomal protein S18-alanine N-acetyltransferase [Acetivibrio clariflavus]AEV70288.1 ribosomal-protein-alanine acetyltransferase [Acetivibrio clariflavus DSM 19732]